MEKDFERTIDALNEIFPLVDGFLSEHDIGADDALAIRLAVEELFTNLVRHNSGGRDRISLALEKEGDRLIVRLTDFAVDRFDPSKIAVPKVKRPISERKVGGLGVYLVRKLFDELTYEYENRTLSVTATRDIGRKDVRHPAS